MAKRNADSMPDSESHKKTRMEGDVGQELRLLIENHEAGAVIGKAGSKINQVRTACDCTINILKNESQGPASKERVLVLRGNPTGNAKAIEMMVGFWLESANTRAAKAEPAGPEVVEYMVKLLIHKVQAGAVIGKAGARIKEMTATSGCHIQLSNDPLPGSTEKTVSLKGSKDQIFSAAAQVLTALDENQLKLKPGSSNIPYTPGAPVYPTAPAGAYDPYAMAAFGAYGAPQPDPSRAAYGAPSFQPFPPSAYGGAYAGMSAASQHMGSAGPAHAPAAIGASSERIVVPASMAGAIIGRGGSKIRELNSQSQTSISIGKPEASNPDERVVTINGDPQAIQTAIFMIRQIVEQGY